MSHPTVHVRKPLSSKVNVRMPLLSGSEYAIRDKPASAGIIAAIEFLGGSGSFAGLSRLTGRVDTNY